MKYKVILLFGPTGVGKTDLLDRLFTGTGEIISADSMQVYRRMDIGTAKPSPELLERLTHHLIDIRSPAEQFHVGDFLRLTEELIPQVHGRGRIPVLSGGTAFYFRNFLFGLPEAPQSNPAVREKLEAEREERGLEALYGELKVVDPESAERIAPRDGYRILRALEVFRGSGLPLSYYAAPSAPRGDYDCLTLGLTRPREELYERINRRVNLMMETGLEGEIKSLLKEGWTEDDPGMQGIGYREFLQAARGGCASIGSIVREIQKNSRRYAKRQITFFNTLPKVNWVHPEEEEKVHRLVEEFKSNGCP